MATVAKARTPQQSGTPASTRTQGPRSSAGGAWTVAAAAAAAAGHVRMRMSVRVRVVVRLGGGHRRALSDVGASLRRVLARVLLLHELLAVGVGVLAIDRERR